MFLPAGIDWWQGWLFLVVFVFQMAGRPIISLAQTPRFSSPGARSQRDEALGQGAAVLPDLVVRGDVSRGRAEFTPLSAVALADRPRLRPFDHRDGRFGLGEAVNKFAEPGVRIQTDRGHTVVDTGPYRFVRHPMYAAAFSVLRLPFALGSFLALVPAAVAVIVLVVFRTVLEEPKCSSNELPGYKEYAEQSRYLSPISLVLVCSVATR